MDPVRATDRLARTAATLGRCAAGRKGPAAARSLPALWFVTDPIRTPDPAAVAARLPRGAGVIFRAFGAADAVHAAQRLARIAAARGLVLLVGADEALAVAAGAHGLHLPERMIARAPRLRARRPAWIVTAAAHGPAALALAARNGIDAALVSAVFPSRSPSAGAPIGPVRLAGLARRAGLPVIALGGVDAKTAPRLIGTGAAGLAAVDGFSGGQKGIRT